MAESNPASPADSEGSAVYIVYQSSLTSASALPSAASANQHLLTAVMIFVILKNKEKNDEISNSKVIKLKLLQLQTEMYQLCKMKKEMKYLYREQNEAVSLLQMIQLNQQSISVDELYKSYEMWNELSEYMQ
ncbi:predicted protein [Histoplasma capsulatum H143]|uniref:Uncharacterized protein n=1 Tax=Ajellomyces capsulatus (strain H143) TaxID=544712 RepID=C6HPL3_AJECH|nr:predicted protein [Histoplasma capsulatum H143]